jgi:hypothetical protein
VRLPLTFGWFWKICPKALKAGSRAAVSGPAGFPETPLFCRRRSFRLGRRTGGSPEGERRVRYFAAGVKSMGKLIQTLSMLVIGFLIMIDGFLLLSFIINGFNEGNMFFFFIDLFIILLYFYLRQRYMILSNINYNKLNSFKSPNRELSSFTGKEILSIESYINLLHRYIRTHGKILKSNLLSIVKYSNKLLIKKDKIINNLLTHFESNELSFQKFSLTLENISLLLARSLNSVIININSFNEDDYNQLISSSSTNNNNFIERLQIYDEYINFVSQSVESIDLILLKMDKLQLQTSRLKSIKYENIESLDAIEEINKLIEDTKLYQNT